MFSHNHTSIINFNQSNIIIPLSTTPRNDFWEITKISNRWYNGTFKREFDFNDKILEVIAKNVRKYRKLAGITQEQLAVDIDMSYDYLRRFESQLGREGISLMSLYKISIVLGVTMDKFFEEEWLPFPKIWKWTLFRE